MRAARSADDLVMRNVGRTIAGIAIAATALLFTHGVLDVVEQGLGIRARAKFYETFPFRRSGCGGSNEVSAVSTLRNIAGSQAQFQAATVVDLDGDGAGEPGTFLELSGAAPLRGRGIVLQPPVLSGVFRTADAAGIVSRSGYLFRMHLRRSDHGVARPEWVCVAWPARFDHSGLRTFYADATGAIYATEDARYDGRAAAPPVDVVAPNSAALRVTGTDGNVWKLVN